MSVLYFQFYYEQSPVNQVEAEKVLLFCVSQLGQAQGRNKAASSREREEFNSEGILFLSFLF